MHWSPTRRGLKREWNVQYLSHTWSRDQNLWPVNERRSRRAATRWLPARELIESTTAEELQCAQETVTEASRCCVVLRSVVSLRRSAWNTSSDENLSAAYCCW